MIASLPPPPSLSDQPDSMNIQRLLSYLEQRGDMPPNALKALKALLARAEEAERRATVLPGERDETVIVQQSAHRRGAFTREVELQDYYRICCSCGRTEVVKRYPGARMSPFCNRPRCQARRQEEKRENNAERQRQFRERQRKRR